MGAAPVNAPIRPPSRRFSWTAVALRYLPFADAASEELPLGRLLRLSLFQVSVGMAAVLLTGTLNRVMILELNMAAAIVAAMVALPLVFAPARALIGFRSDTHRSVLGWRRVPYIWFGTLLQFGGFAILPFALLIMSGDTHGPVVIGEVAAAIAFLLVGAGMHTTQTAGLALATDLAPPESRPRVVALLYVTLLAGMLVAALGLGQLLQPFSPIRLIQVIQGVAALTMLLNMIALWKQEARNPAATEARDRPPFRESWAALMAGGRAARLLVAVGLGAAAFSMQDVLLEPYGGEVLGLGVGQTTSLTALWAAGALFGFMLAANRLGLGADPHRLAGLGAVSGIAAFAAVIVSAPLQSVSLLGIGILGIGLGGGLFSVGTMIAAMGLARDAGSGLALGAWGAVQATAAGLAILAGGMLRDIVGNLAVSGRLGPALDSATTGYSVVWHIEILLLFAALVALGPLARWTPEDPDPASPSGGRFGLSEFPT
jgi:BCD family chlorophyll transporter-like MFS transporter